MAAKDEKGVKRRSAGAGDKPAKAKPRKRKAKPPASATLDALWAAKGTSTKSPSSETRDKEPESGPGGASKPQEPVVVAVSPSVSPQAAAGPHSTAEAAREKGSSRPRFSVAESVANMVRGEPLPARPSTDERRDEEVVPEESSAQAKAEPVTEVIVLDSQPDEPHRLAEPSPFKRNSMAALRALAEAHLLPGSRTPTSVPAAGDEEELHSMLCAAVGDAKGGRDMELGAFTAHARLAEALKSRRLFMGGVPLLAALARRADFVMACVEGPEGGANSVLLAAGSHAVGFTFALRRDGDELAFALRSLLFDAVSHVLQHAAALYTGEHKGKVNLACDGVAVLGSAVVGSAAAEVAKDVRARHARAALQTASWLVKIDADITSLYLRKARLIQGIAHAVLNNSSEQPPQGESAVRDTALARQACATLLANLLRETSWAQWLGGLSDTEQALVHRAAS